MGVTTEPPWLHKTVGTAAKNGTNTHTITFSTFGDAPFTPVNGSLLLLWVHGAVTNTVGGGWTKQAGPVATGELSLFTKVCAGDTSFTITHNASNYAVAVCVEELPSGSTVTGVDSTTATNDTAQPLSGLPGTEQLIISAIGRVPIGSESGASISPGAPYVEVADHFIAAGGGTDGAYLAVWHRINYTGTSITPTVTPTYGGSWGNNTREKISVAINAVAPPAGTTPFTKDWSTTWRVTNAFTKDYSTTWRVTNAFTKDWSTSWRVSTSFTKDWSDTWRITNAFTKDYATSWRVLNGWTKDWSTDWVIRGAFTKDWVTTWVIRNAFTKDWSTDWRVLNGFTKDWSTSWDVFTGTGWTKDWSDTWRIQNAFTADWVTSWRVLNAWQKDYSTTWDVLPDTSWYKEWSDSWRIRNGFLKDYLTTWRIYSDTLPPPLPADVVVRLSDSVSMYFDGPTVIVRLP